MSALFALGPAKAERFHRHGVGAALHSEDVVGRLHERDRVDRATVDPDFIVQVASGRAAGRAHAADQLAAGHALAGADNHLRHVTIAGLDPAAVVDLDEIAVA